MEDDFQDLDNLMDDDPALDYILYEDMEHGNKGGNGCLGIIVLLILPLAAIVICLDWSI